MTEHLPVRQNSQVALRKAKSLISATNQILDNKTTEPAPSDDSWMQRLWDWADEYGIEELEWIEDVDSIHYKEGVWSGLPREQEKLLSFTSLGFGGFNITKLPPEIGRLTNLINFEVYDCSLTKVAGEIGGLTMLEGLSLDIIRSRNCRLK